MLRIERFKQRAVELACSSTESKKVGCILTSGNNIISEGTNISKTHPVQANFARRAGQPERVWLHAELRALITANDEANICFVARVNRKGFLRSSKPCKVCSLALKEANIKWVYFTSDKGWHKLRVDDL